MSADELLPLLLLAEAAMLIGGLVFLFGHVAQRRFRRAWLRTRIAAFRTTVTQTLAGQQPAADLRWLPQEEIISVLAEAARTVDLTARAHLAELPAYGLLVRRANRWCHSRRWPRRLKGVRLLTILAAGETVVPRLLDDTRPEVRRDAAAWVADHPSRERLPRLVQMLDDDALACRLAARATLVRLGRLAVSTVAQHLTDAEPAALAGTLTVAARLNDPRLLEPTLAHRSSAEPAVRIGVAQVLSGLGGTEATKTLQELLGDPDSHVRATAATGLGNLAHWPSAPLLADRLGDEAWEVRHAAGLALSRLDAPGRLYLQRARQATDRFAADMAQQVLDLPDRAAPVLPEH